MFIRGLTQKKPASLQKKQAFSNTRLEYYLPVDKDTVGKRAIRVPVTVPLFDVE